jgi:glyoxylase-like metal-dependent hydrolase (beta-lactamase superfamily II)
VEKASDFEASWKKLLGEDISTVVPAHGKPFPVADLRKNIGFVSQIKLRAL